MSLSELLNSTGGRTAKFETVGASITGTVVAAEARQRTDLDTGKPATWDNGDPQMQVVITLATDERDPDDPDDDGHRNVYVKAWGPQLRALRDAVRASGAKDIEAGGVFTATYSGDGERPKPHMSPPKLFTYTYQPPVPGTSSTAGLLGGGGSDPEQAAAVPQQAPASAGPDPKDVETAKSLIAAGLADDVIAASCPSLPPTVIAALRNAT